MSLFPNAQTLAESLHSRDGQDSSEVVDQTTASIKGVLAHLGGIAGVHQIAEQCGIGVRAVRDRLRGSSDVRKLGAGYFALVNLPVPPVERWTEAYLRLAGEIPFAELVEAIMTRFPWGHRRSVEAWLRQEPGRIGVRGLRVLLRDMPAIVI